MALNGLVEKAEKAKSNWWKWVLGAIIAVVLGLAAWRLSVLISEYRRLRTEKELAEERAKDLEAKSAVEKNDSIAEAMLMEALAIRKGIAAREDELAAHHKEIEASSAAVDRAKTWRELRAQAKGDST